jgi:hypothetical protein
MQILNRVEWFMKKYSAVLALLLLTSVYGRENPFFPVSESQKQKVTSNIPDTRPKMGTISYSFPDQARILKEVTFTIQNVDGSFEEKKVEIDQSIDWHRPVVLSQGSAAPKSPNVKQSAVANFGFIQLLSNGKSMTIKSIDPLIRHFALSNPNRIVLDFKHNGVFKSEEKGLNAAPYVNVSLGNHGEFARLTITLDGRYGYTLNKSGGLISITCK